MTFLGPSKMTFSHIAMRALAKKYDLRVSDLQEEVVDANEEILPTILQSGGYGVIAMDTEASGRVDTPWNSFVDLFLRLEDDCSFTILGALPMEIEFALMANKGTKLSGVKTVHGHIESLTACRAFIDEHRLETVQEGSNGYGLTKVHDIRGKSHAAFGPASAAEVLDLEVLLHSCSVEKDITTFFLLGPRWGVPHVMTAEIWRAFLVFQIEDECGALIKMLQPMSEYGVNMRSIHSKKRPRKEGYVFAIEVELKDSRLEALSSCLAEMSNRARRMMQFGPYPVVHA